MYQVTNQFGVKKFKRETDALDYAIRIIKQVGIKSKVEKLQPYISPEKDKAQYE